MIFKILYIITLFDKMRLIPESCDGVKCGPEKACLIRDGRPKCICAPKCKEKRQKGKGIVCGTDGRSYKNTCRLRKKACRKRNLNLAVAYYGTCQSKPYLLIKLIKLLCMYYILILYFRLV